MSPSDDSTQLEGRLESTSDRFRLMPTQHLLYRMLTAVHSELADFYRGGAMVLNDQSNPARAYVAAHIGRDILDRLDLYLEQRPPGEDRMYIPVSQSGPDHSLRQHWSYLCTLVSASSSASDQVERALGMSPAKLLATLEKGLFVETEVPVTRRKRYAAVLGTSPQHPTTKTWVQIGRALHGRAHLRNPDQAPPTVAEAEEWFGKMEDALIARFAPYYYGIAEIDQLLHIAIPTPEDFEQLTLQLADQSKKEYFFNKLDNPDWLPLLHAQGLFDQPPSAITDREENTITYEIWPESRCLARLAADAPDIVFPIIKLLIEDKGIDNGRILADFTEAALAMPVAYAAEIARHVPNWLRDPQALFLRFKIGDLISKLANDGKAQAGLQLADSALQLHAPEPTTATAIEQIHDRRNPAGQIDPHAYKAILNSHYPDVVKACGMPALQVLCNHLKQALKIEGRDEGAPDDLSYMWRRAIEEHPQNLKHYMKDHLVDAVRDAAKQIIRSDPAQAAAVLDCLHDGPFTIFRRIELHVLAENPDTDSDRAAQRLCDRSLFDNKQVHHEYYMLSQAFFGRLSEEGKDTILAWIDAGGPDIENRKEWHKQKTGEVPTEELVEGWQADWRLKRLRPIRDFLSPDRRRRYDQWVAEYGEPEHADFLHYSITFHGPTSLKSKDELLAMTPEEVIAFLASYTLDSDEHMGPSPEGLGRELAAAVKDDPASFAEHALNFEELKPTYARALLSGLEDACKEQKAFRWEPVLQLCKSIAPIPPAPEKEASSHGDEDPDWQWCQGQIPTLLEQGFRQEDVQIPFEYRDQAWQCLQPLTRHTDPTRESEARYGGDNMDPPSLAINTVRGKALEAVLWYGVWCARHLDPDHERRLASHLLAEELPELRHVLNERLDLEVEPSLAVHSLYGMHFRLLLWLDRRWTEESIDRIFPKEPRFIDYRRAAWEAYISFNQVYTDIAIMLDDEYHFAFDAAEQRVAEGSDPSDADNKLVERIMVLYLVGEQEINGKLVSRVFENLSGKLRAHAVQLVGRFFDDVGPTIPKGQEYQLERVLALWEWRLEQLGDRQEDPNAQEELEAFGWVFTIHVLDPKRSLDLMLRTLELTSGKMTWDHGVMKRLVHVADQHPLAAVKTLNMMVTPAAEASELWAVHFDGRPLLEAALESGNDEAKKVACQCINMLGEKGIDEFRDLYEDYCKPPT